MLRAASRADAGPRTRDAIRLSFAAAILAAALHPSAQAGRPLAVDEAAVSGAGECLVDVWYARQGASRAWNLAPECGIGRDLEIGIAFARDVGLRETQREIKLKWVPLARERGLSFGFATSYGETTANPRPDAERAIYAIGSWNGELWATHVNAGGLRTDDRWRATWGLALERKWSAFVGHVEVFGSKGERPTRQVGLRMQVGQQWELNGSLGHQDGPPIVTVGLRRQF